MKCGYAVYGFNSIENYPVRQWTKKFVCCVGGAYLLLQKSIYVVLAGPTSLKAHKIAMCQGRRVTSYPSTGVKEQFEEGGAYIYVEDAVCVDGNLVTSRGPGTAIEWSIRLIELLCNKEKAREVAQQMLVPYPAK